MKTKFTLSDNNLKDVGKIIRELRIKKGYSSAEIFSYDYELNRTTYSRWETGTNITLNNFFRICEIHGINPKDFFELMTSKKI